MNELNVVMGVLGAVMMGTFLLGIAIAKATARKIRDDYRQGGGAKGVAKKAAARGAAEVLKRVVKRRFS